MKYEVWNKHPMGYAHKEKFKGDDIIIKANDFILMDYEDAVQFKGQYFPMKYDGTGVQDPVSYKCIQIVPHSPKQDEKYQPIVEFVSQLDGKKFATQKELDAHLATLKDQVIVDHAAEDEIKRDQAIAKKIKGN